MLFLFSIPFFPQITIGSNEKPAAGALLQLKNIEGALLGGVNSDKGLMLPRVSLVSLRNLQPTSTSSDAESFAAHTGLTVFNSTFSINGSDTICKGLYVWDGAVWTPLLKLSSPESLLLKIVGENEDVPLLAGDPTNTFNKRQFRLTATDPCGEKVTIDETAITWRTNTNNYGSINSSGLFTAGQSGDYANVSASLLVGGVSRTATSPYFQINEVLAATPLEYLNFRTGVAQQVKYPWTYAKSATGPALTEEQLKFTFTSSSPAITMDSNGFLKSNGTLVTTTTPVTITITPKYSSAPSDTVLVYTLQNCGGAGEDYVDPSIGYKTHGYCMSCLMVENLRNATPQVYATSYNNNPAKANGYYYTTDAIESPWGGSFVPCPAGWKLPEINSFPNDLLKSGYRLTWIIKAKDVIGSDAKWWGGSQKELWAGGYYNSSKNTWIGWEDTASDMTAWTDQSGQSFAAGWADHFAGYAGNMPSRNRASLIRCVRK